MKKTSYLTMVVREVTDVPNVEGNGCKWIATCLETEEYYRIFESNREYQYVMTGPAFAVMFYMDNYDKESGVAHFMVHKNDTKETIYCTLYKQFYYQNITESYEKLVEQEEEASKEKQYQLSNLKTISA